MWGEVADEISATARDRLAPVLCVLDELVFLGRIDVIRIKQVIILFSFSALHHFTLPVENTSLMVEV